MTELSNILYLTFLKHSGISCFLQENPNNFFSENLAQIKKTVEFNDINKIEDLLNFVNTSNVCKLTKNSKKTFFSRKIKSSKILIITGKPNSADEQNDQLLSGPEGHLLKKMFNAINLDIDAINIASIVPWVTPNNREATSIEILECLPFIQKLIEIIKPEILFLLGETACKAILSTPLDLMKVRGKFYEYKSLNLNLKIPTLVTYHPYSLLNNPSYKKQSWEDLKMLEKKMRNEN
jgi:uracil-DNA glycosylase family 4